MLQQYADVITKESLINFYSKATILAIAFIIIKIGVFYTLANLKNILDPNKKEKEKRVKSFNELTPFELRRLSKQVDKIETIKKPSLFSKNVRSIETHKLCLKASNLFKIAMQNKRLKRIDIVYLRAYLSTVCIQYPRLDFKNDAHYIYTVLKYAKDIEKDDIEKFISYIDCIKYSDTLDTIAK